MTENRDFADVDIETLKAVHRSFPTGVTIVTTTQEDNAPRGITVNAFSSVSLTPPLILVCAGRASTTHPHFYRSRRFGVSILARDQTRIAVRFAQKQTDKFTDIAWHWGEHGCPLIDGACAHLEAHVEEQAQTDTHSILIGRVLSAAAWPRAPLVYFAGEFFDGNWLLTGA